ncbi:hypothetical protein [Streptomyces chryseus]|uniref:PPM-type phosphatase domain-containing protein n=1 Tax=Streptomyces chryseus TaxID=68186 RepID=A0ABQ3DIF2_9ACTN|nr:hypothetical protein [Streptomyces chryseus]GHA94428.1 hypothetical protein GCM10010346_16490 [Streptomyces chryseus]
MRTYATAQHTGTDPGQCDATAVRTAPDGTRAYVLLDGIGRREETHRWALGAARQIAGTAARRENAEAGLRHVYNLCREDAIHYGYSHKAAAVVAVKAPGKPLTVAWTPARTCWSAGSRCASPTTTTSGASTRPPPPIRTAATGTTSPPASARRAPTRT